MSPRSAREGENKSTFSFPNSKTPRSIRVLGAQLDNVPCAQGWASGPRGVSPPHPPLEEEEEEERERETDTERERVRVCTSYI